MFYDTITFIKLQTHKKDIQKHILEDYNDRNRKKQKLLVVKIVEFGVYLAENKEADAKNRVLLPAKQVPQGTKEGDCLDVFIYKDSQDRLIATTREPAFTVGQTAVLKVRQVTRIGAFLDWGLEKDLLLPIMSRPYG